MYTTRKLLANNITYFRHKRHWSQETFAENLNSSPAYVSQIENAKRNVTIDFFDKIAFTLGVEPSELLKERKIISSKRVNQRNN